MYSCCKLLQPILKIIRMLSVGDLRMSGQIQQWFDILAEEAENITCSVNAHSPASCMYLH